MVRDIMGNWWLWCWRERREERGGTEHNSTNVVELFQCDIIIITTTYDYGEHVGLDSQEVVFYDHVFFDCVDEKSVVVHACFKRCNLYWWDHNGAKKMHQNMNWDWKVEQGENIIDFEN